MQAMRRQMVKFAADNLLGGSLCSKNVYILFRSLPCKTAADVIHYKKYMEGGMT